MSLKQTNQIKFFIDKVQIDETVLLKEIINPDKKKEVLLEFEIDSI